MESITLLVAVIGCLLILKVKPIYGLAIYTIVAIWYPYSVGKLSIGTIDFSAGRIILIALFLKIFFTTNLPGKFKVIWLDRLVVILFLAEVVAGLATIETMKLIENRSGDFFDMALPYFAVRLIVRNKEQYISLLNTILQWARIFGLEVFIC